MSSATWMFNPCHPCCKSRQTIYFGAGSTGCDNPNFGSLKYEFILDGKKIDISQRGTLNCEDYQDKTFTINAIPSGENFVVKPETISMKVGGVCDIYGSFITDITYNMSNSTKNVVCGSCGCYFPKSINVKPSDPKVNISTYKSYNGPVPTSQQECSTYLVPKNIVDTEYDTNLYNSQTISFQKIPAEFKRFGHYGFFSTLDASLDNFKPTIQGFGDYAYIGTSIFGDYAYISKSFSINYGRDVHCSNDCGKTVYEPSGIVSNTAWYALICGGDQTYFLGSPGLIGLKLVLLERNGPVISTDCAGNEKNLGYSYQASIIWQWNIASAGNSCKPLYLAGGSIYSRNDLPNFAMVMTG